MHSLCCWCSAVNQVPTETLFHHVHFKDIKNENRKQRLRQGVCTFYLGVYLGVTNSLKRIYNTETSDQIVLFYYSSLMSGYDAHVLFCTLGHAHTHKGHLSTAGLPAEEKAGLFCVNQDGEIRKSPNKSICVNLSGVCRANCICSMQFPHSSDINKPLVCLQLAIDSVRGWACTLQALCR